MNEIREISVGASVDRKVVLDIAIEDGDGVCTMVSKRMDISFAEQLQRKLDVAIRLATEGRKELLMKSLSEIGYGQTQSDASSEEQSPGPNQEVMEQPVPPAPSIEEELREVINDLGKSAMLRDKRPMESSVHFMGAIRRLRGLREKQCMVYGGLCHEANDTLEVADKLHRTLAGGN